MVSSTIPTRHGVNRDQAERIARPLLWLIHDRQAARPSETQWRCMGQALLRGDPPADALAQWIQGDGRGQGFRQFDQALRDSPTDHRQLAEPIRRFLQAVEPTPDWLDWDRLERGVAASALSGQTGMRVLRDFGLMAGYQASGINQTLIKTGALESGPARRVAETTRWWMDCTTPGALRPGAEGYHTTLRVRLVHALVRQQLLKRPDWEIDRLGVPVNQLDMQATYLAFSVQFLLGQRLMGTVVRRQEAEDIMHLWRYIGWLMGVEEGLLCASEQDGRIALYQNLLTQATADESSRQLGRALMDEPLGRHYPYASWLRGRWDKQVHLSMVRWFVGRRGMAALGLPTRTLPWYPALFAPLNAAWCLVNRSMPGGSTRLQTRGRRAQQRQFRILCGRHRPDITTAVLQEG